MANYSVHGHVNDWRAVRGKLLSIRDELEKSVNDDCVKTSIYSQIYETGIPNRGIPMDTGALATSPTAEAPQTMGKGRVAFGGIDADGIHYDPYSTRKEGTEKHYAQVASENAGWYPIQNIEEDISQGFGNSVVLDIVYKELKGRLNG